MDPEINNLVHTFFAAISDFEILMFSLLGGLEPPRNRAAISDFEVDFFYASFKLCSMKKVCFWEPET